MIILTLQATPPPQATHLHRPPHLWSPPTSIGHPISLGHPISQITPPPQAAHLQRLPYLCRSHLTHFLRLRSNPAPSRNIATHDVFMLLLGLGIFFWSLHVLILPALCFGRVYGSLTFGFRLGFVNGMKQLRMEVEVRGERVGRSVSTWGSLGRHSFVKWTSLHRRSRWLQLASACLF